MSTESTHWPNELNEAAIEAHAEIGRLIALLPNDETARKVAKRAQRAADRLLHAELKCGEFWQQRANPEAARRMQEQFSPEARERYAKGWDALTRLDSHTTRSDGLTTLSTSYLHWRATKECGMVINEREADTIDLLLSGHQGDLQTIFDDVWATWTRREDVTARTNEEPLSEGYKTGHPPAQD